jgi:hypothetical protein
MTAPENAIDSVSDSRSNFLVTSNSSFDTTKSLNQSAREIDQSPEQEFDIMNEYVSGSDFSGSLHPQVDTQQSGRRSNRKVVKNSKEVQDMTNSVSPSDRPNNTWTLENLETYARKRADTIYGFGRKTITQTWLFGEALSMIEVIKKKDRTWVEWIKTQNYSLSTASNAIKLFERVSFEDLESFDGMTTTELKAMLDIIKRPPVKKRHETPAPIARTEATDAATDVAPETSADQSVEGGSEHVDAGDHSAESVTVRKLTTTDYTRPSHKKNSAPEVGPSLTASEVLGRAFTLLVEVEKIGITPDCNDILTLISAKVAVLIQALNVEVAA